MVRWLYFVKSCFRRPEKDSLIRKRDSDTQIVNEEISNSILVEEIYKENTERTNILKQFLKIIGVYKNLGK